MNIGLFIPCYIDQMYPQVGIATLQLLEKLGLQVNYPLNQTCCGQPMANSGFEYLTKDLTKSFINNFSSFDYIVCPSGSCTLHVKDHLLHEDGQEISPKVYELTEFLTDVIKVDNITAFFPHKVGIHQSCHGLRGLYLAQMSELVAPSFSKPEQLLKMVKGLELSNLERKDECCGFGGTFSVFEEAVSVKMGQDRVNDHISHGVEYITGVDMSCLMHMEGILRRQKSNVKVVHIAEILNAK
jgi:L-lactate dehydrogenase complex protein LldE